MWLFKKNVSLNDCGVFDGFTEWHSHILNGVDDGVKTMDESLKILRLYEDLGVKTVWLTPHIMEDIPNTTAALQQRFEELQSAYKGSIDLHLSAENMLDNLFLERLEKNDVLPMGDNGDYLLVETSYFNPPMALEDILKRIKAKGFFPVLAHPERYTYMGKSEYQELKNLGVKFQLNLLSLVGAYGTHAQKKAEELLKGSMYNMSGSDVHRLSQCNLFNENHAFSHDVVKRLNLSAS